MRGWFGALAVLFGLMGALWTAILFGDAKRYAPILIGVGNPFGVLHLTCWIFLFISRYSFAGEVCSGSYLTAEDYEKDSDIERKYLIDMGALIRFVWWLWFLSFILLIALGTVLFCVTMRNTQNR